MVGCAVQWCWQRLQLVTARWSLRASSSVCHTASAIDSSESSVVKCWAVCTKSTAADWRTTPSPSQGINQNQRHNRLLLTFVTTTGLHAITTLPDSIGSLPALTCLLLHGANALEALPASIGGLGSLVRFRMEHCHKCVAYCQWMADHSQHRQPAHSLCDGIAAGRCWMVTVLLGTHHLRSTRPVLAGSNCLI